MRSTPERRRFHRPWPSSAWPSPSSPSAWRSTAPSVRWTWVPLILCVLSCVSAQEYVVPQATLEALTPRGIRASIPDSWGVQLFAFHGNINKPMRNLEAGDLSADITRKSGDRWVYTNDRMRLKIGDIINYWIYVKVDGLGYRLDDQSWQVVEFVSADSPVGAGPTFTLLPSTNTEGTYTRPSSTSTFGGSSSNFGGSESISNSNYPGSSNTNSNYPGSSNSNYPGSSSSNSNYPGSSSSSSNYPGTSSSNYPGSGSNSNVGSFGATNPSSNEGSSNTGGGSSSMFSNSRPSTSNNRPSSTNTRPTSTNSRPTTSNNRPADTDYTGTSNFGSNNNRPVDSLSNGDYENPRPTNNRPTTSNNRPTNSNNRPTDTDYTSNLGSSNNRPVDSLSNGDYESSRPTNNRPTTSNNRPTTSNNRPTDTDYTSTFGSSNNRPVDSFSNGDYESSRPTSNRPTSTNNRPIDTGSRPTNSFGSSNNRPVDSLSNGDYESTGSNSNVGDYPRPKPSKPQTSRPPTPAPAQQCVLSTTTVNGQPACKNHVIFEETFRNLDLRRWSRDIRIPSHPDFEFCVFSDEPDTLWVQNDALHLRPRLTEDRYGEDFVRTGNLVLHGCTAGPSNAESCSRQAVFSYILPPTLSSRVSTKDSFRYRYGLLEIRAKLPLGDWIYPEMLLLPYAEQYGPGISSGRVQIAMSRGNRQLGYRTGTQIGAKRLEYGVMAGAAMKILHRDANRQWADQFHNYSLLWTPETMAFSVDGVELGIIRPESYGGLLRSDNSRDPWSNGDVLAPFDKEFYLSLGLAVGGVRTFPDDTVTGGAEGNDKPWSNTDAKAMLRFWNAKELWYPTWGNRSELIIESIRVTALNH